MLTSHWFVDQSTATYQTADDMADDVTSVCGKQPETRDMAQAEDVYQAAVDYITKNNIEQMFQVGNTSLSQT